MKFAKELKPLTFWLSKSLELSQRASLEFSDLKPEALQFKPEPGGWSIAQCLDHICVSDSQYFTLFDQLKNNTFQPGWWARNNPWSYFLGDMMIRQLGSEVKRKYKSPDIFRPSESQVRANIVEEFLQHAENMRFKFSEIESHYLKGTIVNSPASAWVTYPVSKLIPLLIVHMERHLNQASRVKTHPNFPS